MARSLYDLRADELACEVILGYGIPFEGSIDNIVWIRVNLDDDDDLTEWEDVSGHSLDRNLCLARCRGVEHN